MSRCKPPLHNSPATGHDAWLTWLSVGLVGVGLCGCSSTKPHAAQSGFNVEAWVAKQQRDRAALQPPAPAPTADRKGSSPQAQRSPATSNAATAAAPAPATGGKAQAAKSPGPTSVETAPDGDEWGRMSLAVLRLKPTGQTDHVYKMSMSSTATNKRFGEEPFVVNIKPFLLTGATAPAGGAAPMGRLVQIDCEQTHVMQKMDAPSDASPEQAQVWRTWGLRFGCSGVHYLALFLNGQNGGRK